MAKKKQVDIELNSVFDESGFTRAQAAASKLKSEYALTSTGGTSFQRGVARDYGRSMQALFQQSDRMLAVKAHEEAKAAAAAEARLRASMGGQGRSAYALQTRADQINAQIAGDGGIGTRELVGILKVTAAVRLGIEGVRIGTQLWKGDLEGVADSVQKLPLGIGRAAQSIKEIMMEWSGANAEIAKHNKAVAELEERTTRIQKATSASDQLNTLVAGLRVENITDPFDQELARARLARDNALAEVERIAKAGGDVTGERSAEARRRIQTEFRQAEDDIEHRRAVAKDAEEKREEDGLKAKADAKLAAAARLAELDDQIRAKELESIGQHLDAQLVMLRRSYDQRIAMAESAEEKERLARLRALDEAALIQGSQAGPLRRSSVTVDPVAVSARFRGLAAAARAQDDPAERAVRIADATLSESKKQSETLKGIAKTLEDRGRGQQVVLLPARL